MKIFYGVLLTLILFFNIRIYFGPDLTEPSQLQQTSLGQLSFLEKGLKNKNFGKNAQSIFPEGFVFLNALYGLSWCEIARKQNPKSQLFKKAMSEAKYAYNEIKSQEAKSTFSQSLILNYGAFYNSWANYLLAKIVSIQNTKTSNEAIVFQNSCEEINAAFIKNSYFLLESYPNQTWPADNMGMIASLKVHDKLFGEKYSRTIKKLVERLDVKNNVAFISHSLQKEKTYPRGSSSSLMLIFLPEIDPKLALKVYENFKKEFLIYRLGQGGIREYPENIMGNGDIDSGPVFFDVGFSGTIVSVGTFLKFNETKIANKISREIETLGLPISTSNQKRYLFGALPIADAFILWSRLQTADVSIQKDKNEINPNSNLSFHIVSLIFVGLLLLLILKTK